MPRRVTRCARNSSCARLSARDSSRRWKLFEVRTRASSKDEYLLHPSLGREFSDAARVGDIALLPAGRGYSNCDRRWVVGSGDSRAGSSVIAITYCGGEAHGWSVGQTFAIKYCRVGILNEIGKLLKPRVAILLIGERPGLATAESLSAYMAYEPRATHSDANRNLISNIHARGLSAEDARRTDPESVRADDEDGRQRLFAERRSRGFRRQSRSASKADPSLRSG